MPTVPRSPFDSNHPHTLDHLSVGFPASPEAEMQAADAQGESSHCACCGCDTDGAVLAGTPVQLCPECLMEMTVTTIGVNRAKLVMARIAPEPAPRPTAPKRDGGSGSRFIDSLKQMQDDMNVARAATGISSGFDAVRVYRENKGEIRQS